MFVIILIIIIAMFALISLSEEITRIKTNNIDVSRRIYPNKVEIGEPCNIELTVVNRNKSDVPYLVIEEEIPHEFEFIGNVNAKGTASTLLHLSSYFLNKMEYRKRTYKVRPQKRGAYVIKNMNITVGSFSGLSLITTYSSDFEEVVVYPKIKELSKFKFDITSFQGDNTVKRWIHKDLTFIRGIREYAVGDRMKDINWNASLKAEKLMVKDYDFTADEEMIIIISNELNTDYCGKRINTKIIEDEIDIAVALAWRASIEGISVGIWSNSQLISIEQDVSSEIDPASENFKRILEYCARMTAQSKCDFKSYMEHNLSKFNTVYTYVFLAYYLNDEVLSIMQSLSMQGIKIKIIDVSDDGNIPNVYGVEKIRYMGEEL